MKNHLALLWLKSMIIFLISCDSSGQYVALAESTEPMHTNQDINVGAERISEYIGSLEGKSVAIVANPTSMVEGVHLVDTMLALGVKIIKVFAPEHGFRGDADAGAHIENELDTKTKLPIISLYGSNMKPKEDQLVDVDVVIFDIQDVGARFYTYISTLHYVMEACAEEGKQLIVLDRPNPNGDIVDGPVLDTNFRSFVGMHPIPVLHGMTIGEYAQMINGEGWLKNEVRCSLQIIKCSHYTHHTRYSLPIAPSPNLRTDRAIELYPSLCFFEGTNVSVGRGTEIPFELYAHPKFPDSLPVVIPKSVKGASKPVLANEICHAFLLSDVRNEERKLDLQYLITAYGYLGQTMFKHEDFFDKLSGSDSLRMLLIAGKNEDEIRTTWQSDLNSFKTTRKKYLLYEE